MKHAYRVQIEFEVKTDEEASPKKVEKAIRSDWGLAGMRYDRIWGTDLADAKYATSATVRVRRLS